MTLVAQDLSCKFNFRWQIIEERDKETYKTTLILRAKDEVQVMLSKGCVNAINVLPRSWRLRYILWEIGLQFCNLIHVLYEFYHKRPRMLTVSILSRPNQIKETEIFKESIFLNFPKFFRLQTWRNRNRKPETCISTWFQISRLTYIFFAQSRSCMSYLALKLCCENLENFLEKFSNSVTWVKTKRWFNRGSVQPTG